MKFNKSLLIDLILIALLAFSSIYFLIEMIVGGFIPMKYIIWICVILLIIIAIIFLSFQLNEKFASIRKIMIGILCVLLLAGSFFQARLRNIFDGIDTDNTNVSIMKVITLQESELDNLESLKDHKVGYVHDTQQLTEYALNEVVHIGALVFSYETQDDAFTALDNQSIDAMLISNKDYSVVSEKEEFLDRYKTIAEIKMETENSEVGSEKDLTQEPFTIFITGMDSTGKPNYDGLSDVNMILMIDPMKHHVEMVSIPRDAYVPNPLLGNQPDKLTHLGWNGSDGLVQAVEQIVGFDIDYYAKVSFSSLIEIIDTLGGIDVDVQIEFTEQNENRDYANGGFVNTIHLYPGLQTLDGREALAYARHRHTDGWGDFGRNIAQRQIIEAIVEKVLSAEGVAKITDVLEVGSQYVATNMPMSYVKEFVNYEIGHLRAWTFSSTNLLNGYGASNHACASMGFQPLWVYLLSQSDLDQVYTKYLQMYDEETLADFGFDLNNLEAGTTSAPMNPYLVTWENYTYVMSTYFPEYLEFANQDFSGGTDTEENVDENGNPIIDPENPEGETGNGEEVPTNPDGPQIVDPEPGQEEPDDPIVDDPHNEEPIEQPDGPEAPEGME